LADRPSYSPFKTVQARSWDRWDFQKKLENRLNPWVRAALWSRQDYSAGEKFSPATRVRSVMRMTVATSAQVPGLRTSALSSKNSRRQRRSYMYLRESERALFMRTLTLN
jgi:hypothetical protein